MAQIKLDLSVKNPAETIQLGTNVHTALTGNAYVPTPNPLLPAFLTDVTNAQAAEDAYEAAKDNVVAKKLARDAALLVLQNALRLQAATCQIATGGDATKLGTTGFSLRNAPTPIGVPAQVVHVIVKPSDMEGALDASWKKVRGADTYETQSSLDTPTAWVTKLVDTKTRVHVNSFTSGQRVWLRIRAIGAAGPGPWSDPSVKTVP